MSSGIVVLDTSVAHVSNLWLSLKWSRIFHSQVCLTRFQSVPCAWMASKLETHFPNPLLVALSPCNSSTLTFMVRSLQLLTDSDTGFRSLMMPLAFAAAGSSIKRVKHLTLSSTIRLGLRSRLASRSNRFGTIKVASTCLTSGSDSCKRMALRDSTLFELHLSRMVLLSAPIEFWMKVLHLCSLTRISLLGSGVKLSPASSTLSTSPPPLLYPVRHHSKRSMVANPPFHIFVSLAAGLMLMCRRTSVALLSPSPGSVSSSAILLITRGGSVGIW